LCFVYFSDSLNRIELSGAASYTWKLFNAPPELLYHKDSFALLSGTETPALIARILTADMLSLFPAAASVLFYFAMMFRQDAALSLIVLALAAVNLLGQKFRSLLVTIFS
jgi:ABC-type bacteriocin/lantibiotic exporter with double-glycine peptidase domain